MRRKWLFIAAAAGVIVGGAGTMLVRGMRGQPRLSVQQPVAESSPQALDSLLNIPLERTTLARQEFLQAYRGGRRRNTRELYERFLPRIGANGLRQVIESEAPFCHVEGHDLGKLIFSNLRDVGASLESCADACTSGCMHGVLMQFFTTDTSTASSEHHHSAQLTAADVAPRIPTFCETSAVTSMYRPGDCAHGVGHAVMFLSSYDVSAGIALCERFRTYALRYYCASGVYMEQRTQPQSQLDYLRHGALYPCGQAAYPAACFRYAMLNTIRWHYARKGTLEALQSACATLGDKYRLGCFHGIGFAHFRHVSGGKKSLAEVCGAGTRDDQTVCVEGAVERIGRFTPVVAAERCGSLSDWRRKVCERAASEKMYDMNKSFALYQR